MTIKPKKESLTHTSPETGNQHSTTHRNAAVIDGQNSKRRSEVFDDLSATRQHRSPQKSVRVKRRDVKRDRTERELHANANTGVGGGVVGAGASGNGISPNKSGSPHSHNVVSSGSIAVTNNASVTAANDSTLNVDTGVGKKTEIERSTVLHNFPKNSNNQAKLAVDATKQPDEENLSGYNSGDEHLQPKEAAFSAGEWKKRDEQFEKVLSERGYILKPVEEDGACLFRAISLQIYGDEKMHDVIRQHTMDYIFKNREYFSHFVTEDINSYIIRKRRHDSHGNHIELHAISEIYSRPVELYCYKSTPINIFNSEQSDTRYAPLRLSYQRGSHYNAVIDPYNATVGEGLGLANFEPQLQIKNACHLSEEMQIEQTMFEDKLKTTDWEATNEAIEEQIARESYLQWCRETLHHKKSTSSTTTTTTTTTTSSSATVTSAEAAGCSGLTMSGGDDIGNQIGSIPTSCLTMTKTNFANGLSTSFDTAAPSTSKMTTALLINLKKSPNRQIINSTELGYESDATDLSSTSSIDNNPSSSTGARERKLKNKNRNATTQSHGMKKRRREQNENSDGTTTGNDIKKAADDLQNGASDSNVTDFDGGAIAELTTELVGQCTKILDADLQPCTSKQSNNPSTLNTLPSTATSLSPTSTMSSPKPTVSSFYQELLASSYSLDGVNQLTESEMLQRAITMSTRDFMEERKRKYHKPRI